MITKFREWQLKIKAYQYAMQKISWDSSTEAPKKAYKYRGKMLGVLSGEYFNLMTSNDTIDMIDTLIKDNSLSKDEKREVELYKRNIDRTMKIPKDEFLEYRKLINESSHVWEEAKEKSDFKMFKPYLKNIVDFQRKLAEYYGYEKERYNALIDLYEEGMTVEKYDEFFNQLRKELVPFVREVLKSNINIRDDFGSRFVSKENQENYCKYIMEVFDYDVDRGGMKTSAHPFCSSTDTTDVRITVKYLEENFNSALYACMHELGHAKYNQQNSTENDGTIFFGGASTATHESQSRFYENHIGRSEEFIKTHFEKTQQIIGVLEDISVDEYYNYCNKVEASFIRVEADELTYPLHVMIRYEIERDLISGALSVDNVEEVWNKKFEEYLGITPRNSAEGVLQDIHWSSGMFGYFPTYSYGTAMATQFLTILKEDIDFKKMIKENNIKAINKWLEENIHKYGGRKTKEELIKDVCNSEFDASHYINYLIEKYSKIYNI